MSMSPFSALSFANMYILVGLSNANGPDLATTFDAIVESFGHFLFLSGNKFSVHPEIY